MCTGPQPYPNPIKGMAHWGNQIGRDTIDNLEKFSDFMEWNYLHRNDLRERIRTGLIMDYHYRNPGGITAVNRDDAAIWALSMTEVIIQCVGSVMRLYSNILE
jgi:hypothetical protein